MTWPMKGGIVVSTIIMVDIAAIVGSISLRRLANMRFVRVAPSPPDRKLAMTTSSKAMMNAKKAPAMTDAGIGGE